MITPVRASRMGFLALTLCFIFTISYTAKALTAEELSHQFDVQSWETTVKPPPGGAYIPISFYRIKDGKIGEGIGGSRSFDSSWGTRLVVLIGPFQNRTRLTLIMSRGWGHIDLPKDISLEQSSALPDSVEIGSQYVLAGSYPAKNNNVTITGKISDVKNGLLIQIGYRP